MVMIALLLMSPASVTMLDFYLILILFTFEDRVLLSQKTFRLSNGISKGSERDCSCGRRSSGHCFGTLSVCSLQKEA
ncbi:hypothetical protein U0070_025179, partial [Myodes glareolus]